MLPNLEARLVVDGDGDGNIDAEEGQPGELWVRGPSVMKVSSIIEIIKTGNQSHAAGLSQQCCRNERRDHPRQVVQDG